MMRRYVMRGGKYKGQTLDYVIKNDPQYVRWALREKIFKITERAEGLLKKSENQKR